MVVHEIIRPRITLLLMFLSFSFFLHSQELVVKGTVKDSSGPLPGVNVSVKDGKAVTVTDIDGKYSIKVPKDGTLNFSFTGYATYKTEVKSRSIIYQFCSSYRRNSSSNIPFSHCRWHGNG